MYKLSVIIPCYNAEKYIEQCMTSVINQTIGIQNLQVLLINDASTDRTLAYLEEYQQQYPDNIFLFNLRINQGQAKGRNLGIENAAGEYIAFLDADDWLELSAYEKLLAAAQRTNADLIQANYIEHLEGKESAILPHKHEIDEDLYVLNETQEKSEFFSKYQLYPLWAGIYKQTLFHNKEIRFKDFRKYEDNYFGGIIQYEIDSYYPLADYLYHYRLRMSSNSHTINDLGHFIRLEVELETLKYYMENGLYHKFYNVIRKNFLEAFYNNTMHIIFCKYDYIPVDQIQMMQKMVRQFFPDYLDYYREGNFTVNLILTVPFDFPIEEWENIKRMYMNMICGGKPDEIVSYFSEMKNFLEIGNRV